MGTSSRILVAVSLALVAACGGSQPPPAAPPAPAAEQPDAGAIASADAGAAPATKAWNDMGHEERLALMKTTVLPKMKTAFQGFDAKDFADFSCVTCHGEAIKKGKFDMPNPELPKLDAKTGFKNVSAKHPAMMKFMGQTVVPSMADMLGEPKWDPATGKGFGCGNCHVME